MDSWGSSQSVGLLLICFSIFIFFRGHVTASLSDIDREKKPFQFFMFVISFLIAGVLFFLNILKVKS